MKLSPPPPGGATAPTPGSWATPKRVPCPCWDQGWVRIPQVVHCTCHSAANLEWDSWGHKPNPGLLYTPSRAVMESRPALTVLMPRGRVAVDAGTQRACRFMGWEASGREPILGRGEMAGARLQTLSTCFIVPVDFTYKTPINR